MAKILILNGSPHLKGNTSAMVDSFLAGAKKAQNEVVVYNGYNCLITISENNSLCNLIYNKDFDFNFDSNDGAIKLDDYLNKQWDIIDQYIK